MGIGTEKMKVLLETSPLRNAHAIRGVGVYTRFLSQELEKLETKTDQFITQEDIGLDQLTGFVEKNAVDIIHYPYFDLFQQTLPLPFVSRFLGRKQKIVVTIHDVIPLLYPTHYPVGIRGNLSLLLQKNALSGVAAVITDSQTSKTDIAKYLGVPLNKIHVVQLAGNPGIHKVNSQLIKETKVRFGLPEKYLLYVGDINYNKNIPALLKAIKHVDQSIHLVCVGKNFRPQSIPEWQAIAEELHEIKDRVTFVTSLPSDQISQLAAIYSGAALYVQPSLYEGFGLPLLEAMQCETLVLSSNTPALIEIGGKGVEFVAPTEQGFSKGITKMLNLSLSEKKQRIFYNTENVDRFSWQRTAQETVSVYKSLL